MRVVALIPAYNEEDCITDTISAVATIKPLDQIAVIDDGSTDRTKEMMDQARQNDSRITLFSSQQNKGKGAALNHGVFNTVADVYLLLDADLGKTAHLAQGLLDPILQDWADMTIARFQGEQSRSRSKMGFGFVRQSACLGVKLLTGKRIDSPLSGQRAVKAAVLHTLGDFFDGFGVEVALTVGALHHGFRIKEIPLGMKHRAYGRGLQGFRHRGRQWVQVSRALWSCWRKGWHK